LNSIPGFQGKNREDIIVHLSRSKDWKTK